MPAFTFQWRYRSSYGEGEAGQTVDLDEATAEAINRDSPGVLVAGERAVKSAPKNRQVTGASDRGAQEPIDKATFKAVREKA